MKSSSRSSKPKAKRSQKHSKKRIMSSREKPKKLKQRDYTVSCSEEDSIKSVSCSSPVNDSRSKKRGRSRDGRCRKDKKRRKRSSLVSESSEDESPRVKKPKKLKKSSLVSESSEEESPRAKKPKKSKKSSLVSESSEDELPRVKKPKKSKKSRGSDSRKKRHVKRRKRDRSISSSSSLSRSCSVGESSGESEREFERKKEKLETKERKGRDKDRERSGSKRKVRHRSRSCSPCSVHSESVSHYSEERVVEKYNPKRLKSVIVVLKEVEVPEEKESNRDVGREDEIVYEYDDYPSKSNDSNDGGIGREAVLFSHDVSSDKRSLDERFKDSVVSDVRTSEISRIQQQVSEGSVGIIQSNVRPKVDVPSMGDRNEVCTANAGSNRDDLEVILRQKALENLLKRQGKRKIPVDMKDDHDTEVKKSSIVKAQLDQPIPHDDENIKSVQNVGKHVNDIRYTTNLPGTLEDTGPSKDNDAQFKVETAHPNGKGKAPSNFLNSRPNLGLSMSRKEPLGAKNTWKRQLAPQETSQKNLSLPTEKIVKDSKQQLISQEYFQPKSSALQETNSKDFTRDSASPRFDSKGSAVKVDANAVAVSEPMAPAPASSLVEQSTNDKTNEADEDAQFQQKTMSVMRGGEMVQVSYKVYIPKKVPALARRQLKR